MSETITVYVIARKGKPNLVMRHIDPSSGRWVERSTGTKSRKAAAKVAAQWEAELQQGAWKPSLRMTWQAFREFVGDHFLSGRKDTTADAYRSALNVFERACKPTSMADFSTQRLNGLAADLRKLKRSPNTIDRHMLHLKAIARWAHKQGVLRAVPTFPDKEGRPTAKGRPLTLEEFERMLAVCEDVVGERAAPSWKFYLRGLLLSGMRLQESLALRWDAAPGCPQVRMDRGRPLLEFPPESHKGGRECLVPMTPDFAALLEQVPTEARKGRVFRPLDKHGKPYPASRRLVGPIVSEIGAKAGVVVKRDARSVKFASAHDLRRTFGHTWSRKVTPAILRELMRHREIGTTMRFYMGDDAAQTAELLWQMQSQPFCDPSYDPAAAEGVEQGAESGENP